MLFDIETSLEGSLFKDNNGIQLFSGDLLRIKYDDDIYLGETTYNGEYFVIKVYDYDKNKKILYTKGYIDLRQYYTDIMFLTCLDFVEHLGINSYNTKLGVYQIYINNIKGVE